ncbi:MAG: type II 3-dehydroquinate dehydratase [Candidatus Marinimicrobia bacterium]|nr:type II 3-dehydroquinate dehydratase [Candidatus Neomarinimicrobiota bacterium]
MKIVVFHGPNMPLLGKVSVKAGARLTLDKLNKTLRKEAGAAGVELKIYQFYDEERILKTISRNRNEISGILINPGPLARTAFSLRELLGILQIPTVEVCVEEFPFSEETFSKSVIKDVVTARFIGAGAEPYLHGLNSLLK